VWSVILRVQQSAVATCAVCSLYHVGLRDRRALFCLAQCLACCCKFWYAAGAVLYGCNTTNRQQPLVHTYHQLRTWVTEPYTLSCLCCLPVLSYNRGCDGHVVCAVLCLLCCGANVRQCFVLCLVCCAASVGQGCVKYPEVCGVQ
jgi:hypothetical protein